MKLDNKNYIKKGDLVKIIAGKETGKTGKVLQVNIKKGRLLIEKMNMVKRHMKPSQQYKQGGVVEKESSISWSNVMIMCAKCDKAVRVKHKIIEDHNKRVCAKCGEVLDT